MSQNTFDDLAQARIELERLREALSAFHAGYDGHWQPNSQAASERAAFKSPDEATAAHSKGAFLIHSAADQLMALPKLLTNPVQTIAPWACVRTMLESSALAAWLLDPTIDVSARVQRSFAWQYEGLEQQLKYVRADNLHDNRTISRIEKAIDQLENICLKLGYPRVQDRNRKRIGIGQRMPSATEVVRIVYESESPYRLTSSFVHGHDWAMLSLSFRVAPELSTAPERDLGDGVVHMVNDALPSNLMLLIEMAGMIFAKPAWYHCCLFGWDRTMMRRILNHWADTLSVKPDCRFWLDGPEH